MRPSLAALFLAISLALPSATRGGYVIDLTATLPGGDVVTAIGAGEFDPCGCEVSGGVEFSSPLLPVPQLLAKKIIAWAIKYSPPLNEEASLIDQAAGHLAGTIVLDLGSGGVATAEFDATPLSYVATLDMTGIIESEIALPPLGTSFRMTASETVFGTGPGTAGGSGPFAVQGVTLGSFTTTYQFLGDPLNEIGSPHTVGFNVLITETSSGFTYEGRAVSEACPIPEPGSLSLLGLGGIGLIGGAIRRRRNAAAVS